MNKFKYFAGVKLRRIDRFLTSENYLHNRWFRLAASTNQRGVHWPVHLSSRVRQLDTPWPTAETISPIPKIETISEQFDQVMDQSAHSIAQRLLASDQIPIVLWSGGIDSTAVIVAACRTWPAELLKKLVVVCDSTSIRENAYFYHKIIVPRFAVIDTDQFVIDQDNYKKFLILDGELGNQVFGCSTIADLWYRQPDLLWRPWSAVPDLQALLPGNCDLNLELVLDSMPMCPVDLHTVYDLLWWSNFNFKADEVLIKPMFYYGQRLSAQQRQYFYDHCLVRLLEQAPIQIWSMTHLEERRKQTPTHPKWHLLKYIFDFDRNDLWFAHKHEGASASRVLRKSPLHQFSPVIGFDQEWNTVSLSDADVRAQLGQILGRVTNP
jgi:hypothetical protein